jgi:valyl-tRNA synthetase
MAGALYQFTWGTFCDWYVEFAKPILEGDDDAAKAETRATAAWALDQQLHLLHPIMPFVTEELWQQLADKRPSPLITSPWPTFESTLIDADANAEMDWVVRLISQVRTVRAEMNVPPRARIPLLLKDAGSQAQARLARHRGLIERLARLSSVELLDGGVPKGAVQDVIEEVTIVLPIADVIDLAGEQARLEREIAKLDEEVRRFEKKLANEKFVANAPEEVVETERERLTEVRLTRSKMDDALSRLTAAR